MNLSRMLETLNPRTLARYSVAIFTCTKLRLKGQSRIAITGLTARSVGLQKLTTVPLSRGPTTGSSSVSSSRNSRKLVSALNLVNRKSLESCSSISHIPPFLGGILHLLRALDHLARVPPVHRLQLDLGIVLLAQADTLVHRITLSPEPVVHLVHTLAM